MSVLDNEEINFFPTYLELPSRLSPAFWWLMRGIALAATFALMFVLATKPAMGLELFWGLTIPVLPLVFAAMPGFWRQVCPMALLNQLPQAFGVSRGITLPLFAKNGVYIVSTLVFFFVVSLRHVYFNQQPRALLLLLAASLVLALVGGLIFKGRSGWCGTLCPLAPIQKTYGLAPVVLVKNGYCKTCVGCQKNCFDFNPRAAMHSDLADGDPWYAGHREFFVAGLPGLAIGFYTAPEPATVGLLHYFLYMGQWIMLTLGTFMAFTRIVRISRYKSALFFSMGALLIFYWYASPIVAGTITHYIGVQFPGPTQYFLLALAVVISAMVIYNGLRAEQQFLLLNAPAEPRVGVRVDGLGAAGAAPADGMVIDRGSGRAFVADPGVSLLEGLESAGVKIDYGCRMGLCGADPILVVEGHDSLSPPSAGERDTLRRLQIEGRGRMACVCRAVRGGVTIDTKLDPRTVAAEPQAADAAKEPARDPAEEIGVKQVVIVGNGAAATAAADEVRRMSASCTIDMIAREKEPFYNRMAIGRLLYGRTAMAGIFLQAPDWAEKNKVTLWLNTSVTAIDRGAHEVVLGTGERLLYQKLILANGSRAAMPPLPGSNLPGCFVLREAADATAIRAWRQQHPCRRAVVLGGGVLGVEAADALRRLNLDVTILHRGERLMDRQLDETGSTILQNFLAGLGINVITEARVAACVGEQRLTGIALESGEIVETELMVACAGIAPNIEIAKAAGLDVGRGIKVDANMRTSDPDILAAGDVAELPGAVSGLWAVSLAQGRAVAASVFGRTVAAEEPNTLVSLKMDGIDVKSFGVTAPANARQEAIISSSIDDGQHRLLIVEDDGVVVGALSVGRPGTGKLIAQLVDQRANVKPILDNLRAGDWRALESILSKS